MKIKYNPKNETFTLKNLSTDQFAVLIRLAEFVRLGDGDLSDNVFDILNTVDYSGNLPEEIYSYIESINVKVVEDDIDSKRYSKSLNDPCIEISNG